jgi:DNA-binding Lrp family transcriptional regulator
MMKLKEKEVEFIKSLRGNSRQTLTQISKDLNVPISTLYDRLKEQEKSTIIKHTTLYDFSKLGYGVKTQIYLRTDTLNKDRLKNFLLNHQNVNNLATLSDEFDFFIEVLFEDITQVRDFIDFVETNYNLLDHKVMFIAKEIRKEGFMAS